MSTLGKDEKLFIDYTSDLFKDLSIIIDETIGVNKVNFWKFLGISKFCSDKIFKTFNTTKSGILSHEEFNKAIFYLYVASPEKKLYEIFNILDFKKNGKIYIEDVMFFSTHLFQNIERKVTVEKQIDNLFKGHKHMDYSVVKNKSDSEKIIFNIIDNHLNKYKNFNYDLIKLYQKNLTSEYKENYSDENNSDLESLEETTISISTLPCLKFENKFIENSSLNSYDNFPNHVKKDKQKSLSTANTNNVYNKIKKRSCINFDSSLNMKKSNVIYLNEGFLYKSKGHGKLTKFYICLNNNNFIYFKNSCKDLFVGLHNLSSCFMEVHGEVYVNSKKFYGFSLIFSKSKKREYFCKNLEQYEKWVQELKKLIDVGEINQKYDLINKLGEGRYGKVYLAKLKKYSEKNEKIAIKIIKKENLTPKEEELIYNEIYILKFCNHENIIKFYDTYENSEYFFIVMEYMQGGDLQSYLINQKSVISEDRIKTISLQIGKGLNYLHSIGVVHRDLKSGNILLTTRMLKPQIKITDFGLSAVISSDEHLNEFYGTPMFAAPEVLRNNNYSHNIDLWSLGIIIFYLITGNLPLDLDSAALKNFLFYIENFELEFPNSITKIISPECVKLVTNCLEIDNGKRLKIAEFLNHEWFRSK